MTVLAPDRLDSLITTNEAAALAGVAVATIRSWIQRGHLTPVGRDPLTDRPLVKFIDVAKAERATRSKARRHV